MVLVFLVLAAFTAGWVDAVVGGGGLIQLPALLLGLPGASPVQILATNKLGSIFGTTTSSITYFRRVRPDLRTALPLAGAAFAGSVGGALIASRIPGEAFNPIILVVLIAVGAYTIFKPDIGSISALRFSGRAHVAVACVVGFLIGAYDGALGPGTGSFLVFALVGLLGYGFLQASAKAKIANMATNAAALVVFIPQGAVLWQVGLMMGAFNVLGGYVGARTAVAAGSGFVRAVFIAVVGSFIVKIGYDTFVQFS
ncbi:MAG: TSUP family transporter [Ornithinimicrobium sp.]